MEEHDYMDKVAIIGMAGRFPGAKNLEEFWQNLSDGVESISFFSDQDLEASGVDPDLLKNPNYVKAGILLEDKELFDSAFFGYPPRQAEIIDPQQRLFLECAWDALESAGYNSKTYEGRISVYGGAGINSYLFFNIASNPDIIQSIGFTQIRHSNRQDNLATRVAYKLNLKGSALTVQTGCSSSLVAVHLACQSLLDHECHMALAGGVCINSLEKTGYLYQEGGISSPDGHCRAFDAKAKGTVSGGGVGIVVLKRLEDAIADGDMIHAVVKGSAINNDGSDKVGYAAPSVNGQAAVITEALAMGRSEAETISYVEAHGTGTVLGDPIEIAALTEAFRATTDKKGFCAIGSVKTNIGHLDTAAGIAGLIKAVLALKHKKIPPSLHFETPNPKIDFTNSPFYVNAVLSEWQANGIPRRAGVSSFGIGGTNAHAILEEAPTLEPSSPSRPWQLLVLSAKTRSALEMATANLVKDFQTYPDLNLSDAAYTLQTGRQAFDYRRMVVVQNLDDAVKALESPDPRRVFTRFREPTDRQIVFMFPGQGAQYVSMGQELYQTEPIFQEQVDHCCELLSSHLSVDLRTILYPRQEQAAAAARQLKQTSLTQPALFVVEYALARLWMAWGISPQAMIGHSIGEYVAACLAGVFSLEDALALVAARGQLMQQLPTGAMLAVPLSKQALEPLLDESLSLAAANAPVSCVVSGPTEAIDEFQERLTQQGVECRRLYTSHAFHSQMMDSIVEPFKEQVSQIRLNQPKIPFVSNVTGAWITTADVTDPSYWAMHLRKTVRFGEGMAELLQVPGRIFLEVGPGRTLSTLTRKQKGVEQTVVCSLRHPQDQASDVSFLLKTLGRLWLEGIQVDWSGLYAHERRHRIPLPTYPFERKRYWIEFSGANQDTSRVNQDNPLPKKEKALSEPQNFMASSSSSFPSKALDSQAVKQNDVIPLATTSIEQIITQHLQVMSKLVDLLSVGDASREELFSREPIQPFPVHKDGKSAQTSTNISVTRANQSLDFCSTLTEEKAEQYPRNEKISPEQFVSSKQVEKEFTARLSLRQKKHLDALIASLVERTRESKKLTQVYRPYHANSRAVSGFFPLLKELVYPIHAQRAEGARFWDVDGNEYIDISMGFGTLLFGHSPSFLIDALQEQIKRGILHGPQSCLAGQVAELICELTSAERVAFCNDGTEAIMGAVRLARSVTGRTKIALFVGSYHGTYDGVLVKGVRTRNGQLRSIPQTSGVPSYLADDVIVLEYGASESFEILKDNVHQLAAILVEPVQSSQPDLQPKEFLFQLRQLTEETGTVLIFDEVITGFRMHPGGIQALWGIRADITTYGKAVGGGIPIGIVAGKAQFMDAIDGGMWNYGDESYPQVKTTFFAGTFFKHPLIMSAAWAVLNHIKRSGPKLQEELAQRTAKLVDNLNCFFDDRQVPIQVVNFRSLFRFTGRKELVKLLSYHLIEKGIYVWETGTLYLSTAHTNEDIDQVTRAVMESVVEMQEGEFFSPSSFHSLQQGAKGREPVPLPISTSVGGERIDRSSSDLSDLSSNLDTELPSLTSSLKFKNQSFGAQIEKPPETLGDSYTTPDRKIEQTITDIWKELFGFDSIGVYENFFELGGDSLSAVQAISLLRKELNVEIPVESIYEAPTINSLTQVIRLQQDEPQDEIPSSRKSISRGQRRREKRASR